MFTLLSQYGHSQCPTCTPDINCISTDGYPAICPTELPEATAGEYYEETLTFYLPPEINDPENGINAILLQITIASVTGLPFGMEGTINDPDATYYPSEGDNYGCATICGTPLLPGIYNINISIDALVEVFGFEVEQSQSFFFTFVVNQGTQGNTGFVFDNQAGCGEVVTEFEALLDLPAITTYAWDFGNGQTSTEQFPPAQVYSGAGEYTVSLTTTVSDYFLNAVNVSSLDDNWTGDVDDFLGSPDVWFSLTDGDGSVVFSSSIVDNNETPSWGDMNLVLSNPPYYISFTDDDLISADDGLGNAWFDLGTGTINFDTGSGTTGSLDISLGVITEVYNEEIISVFPIPDATFDVNGSLLSYDNPELTGFIWLLNGEPIDNQFGSTLLMSDGGLYSCIVSNIYGCSATSEEYLFCPEISITWDQLNNQLFVDDVYTSYQWFFNGLLLEDQTTYYIADPVPGNYSVEVDTDYGCLLESDVVTVTVDIREYSGNHALKIYPNPANEILYVSSEVPGSLFIYYLLGNVILKSEYSTKGSIDISSLSPGVYFVECDGNRQRLVKN
jgi:hypothetical protein